MTTAQLRRSTELVTAILADVYNEPEPVPWLALVDRYAGDRWDWKTVEGTIYDLIAYGALHRIGQPGHTRRPDTRALRPTPLGQAWLARELLPLPHERPDE